MRWALFGALLLVALGVVMFYARREPPAARYVRPGFTVPDPAQRLFGHLFYTEEQSEAITEAGFAIQQGKIPSQTLAATSLAQLRDVDAIVQRVECAGDDPACPAYRLEVVGCLDEAGELIGLRRGKDESITWDLYVAAMGVSVVTREVHYRTVAALVHFCQKFIAAREKLRPKHRLDALPRR